MAGLNLTPQTPGIPMVPPPERSPARERAEGDAEFQPVILLQLQDDLSRSRLREAFWISVVVHLIVLIVLGTSPKWLPKGHGTQLVSAADLLRDKELTYLQMPKDSQKPPVKPPETNRISDKDRIATSRQPSIDRQSLDRLRDSRVGNGAMQQAQRPIASQQAAPPQQQVAQAAQQQPQPTQRENPALPLPSANEQPPRQNPFAVQPSAGSVIQQAVRDSGHSGQTGGGFGEGPPGSKIVGNAEILSDTMGVDFGPYLNRVVNVVRMNWYQLIPEAAMPPLLKRGKVTIEFVILPDGKIAGMAVQAPSGDTSLDRAAWGGITNSNPFQPLPQQFKGPYLRLRFRFYYNPDRNELQ